MRTQDYTKKAASLAVAGLLLAACPTVPAWAADDATKGQPTASDTAKDKAAAKDDKAAKAGDAAADAKADAQKGDKAGAKDQQNKKGPVLIGVITLVPIVTTDPALPKGATFDDKVPDAGDMRDTLAEVTEAAFTKGGFDDLVERLVDQDRNRLGKFAQGEHATLDGRVAQLQKAWKDKYGQDFDIREAKAFAPFAMAQGRIDDPAAFAGRWPLDATPSSKEGDGAIPARAEKVATEGVREQSNIEKGREFGVVRVPAEWGMKALEVSMIDEAYGWKIDVPNNMTGQQLHDNLLRHLTYFGENTTQWPADVNDAYRLATIHVLRAVYGVEVHQSGDKAGQKS